MTVTIRPATKKDLAAIRELGRELDKARTKLWNKENKPFHKKSVPSAPIKKITIKDYIFVADQNSRVVGFVWGEPSSRPNSYLSKVGDINELFVLSGVRGQGVGKKLLQALFQTFKEKGCDHIITHTDSENISAQDLYRSMGMSPVTVELWRKV